MSDYKSQLQTYNNKLNQLLADCSSAEKQVIISETNLNNLVAQKKKLVEQCEAFAGVPIDDVPALINEKRTELDSIMEKLMGIDTNGQVTQEKLDAIKAIAGEFAIVNAPQ